MGYIFKGRLEPDLLGSSTQHSAPAVSRRNLRQVMSVERLKCSNPQCEYLVATNSEKILGRSQMQSDAVRYSQMTLLEHQMSIGYIRSDLSTRGDLLLLFILFREEKDCKPLHTIARV